MTRGRDLSSFNIETPSRVLAAGPSRPFAGLRAFLADERGATAVEYGLIIAGLAALLIGSLSLIGTGLSGRFSSVASNLAK
jgi:pilus assembly protein Flp/PilA